MIQVLHFRLEGPFQSWGDAGSWEDRPSNDYPTKSGIVGLIGCAMGLSRGDERLKSIYDSISLVVRSNKTGCKMTDFQTARGRFSHADSKKPVEDERSELSDGPISTKVRYKQYICDASFTVFITAPAEKLTEIQKAVNDPYWPCFLGRKNCVPSYPIFAQIVECESVEDALRSVDVYESGKVCTYEADAGCDDAMLDHMDAIVDPASGTYGPRLVKRGVVTCI